MLDAVEHRGEGFTIVRRGTAVARLQPISEGRGATIKDLLRRHRPDRNWAKDLSSVRSVVQLEERS